MDLRLKTRDRPLEATPRGHSHQRCEVVLRTFPLNSHVTEKMVVVREDVGEGQEIVGLI